jgi:aminopeptidase-like protein
MQTEIESYFDRLWPIGRSITGNGLRESLRILSEIIPLQIHEIPSGTVCYDWIVPDEWNVNEAYLITPQGKRIADFKVNNLHLLNYSTPIEAEMNWEELAPHLFTLPHLPEAIPYLTSYYKRNWGFCISHQEWEQLPREGKYQVVIQTELKAGAMSYGDLLLPGESQEEILFSTYVCHPSMANNELSGPLVTAFLYKQIAAIPNRKYSYRFIFIPETIGAIAYLSKNEVDLKAQVKAGYVLTCVGDAGAFTYKHSKNESADVNRLAKHVLQYSGEKWSAIPFAIGGSDERQYCSPGFNLPVGSLMRTPYQKYKEYHTSLDNKSFISFAALEGSVHLYTQIVRLFELNQYYVNTQPFGEPNLGKRGLYPMVGGQKERSQELSRRLHLLSFADGTLDLVSIADRMNCSALDFAHEIETLKQAGLLTEKNKL